MSSFRSFLDPQGHVERNIDIDVVVQGFNRACKDANTKYGTTNKLIMCLLRHLPAENGLQTIHSASKYYQDGIIHGLGLDSSENHSHQIYSLNAMPISKIISLKLG